jgi:predicted metal-binding membrane protein
MAVLIALGTMNIGWMLAVAALIFVEKVTRVGRPATAVAAVAMAALAAALFMHPAVLMTLT